MSPTKTTLLIGAICAVSLTLSACGRKGDLDRPGSTAPINTKSTAPGGEVKDVKPDRPFLLDPLL